MPTKAIRKSGLDDPSLRSPLPIHGWLEDHAEPDHRLPADRDADLAFSIHLFRLTVPQQRRPIRILIVAAIDIYGIYEGLGSRSQCSKWLNRLSGGTISKRHRENLLRILDMHSYAALPELWIPPDRLDFLGFQRVDG
ncbi:hypothetical protein HNQ77_003827 [Silvibacterium bohemicum]|uniref:Uncharacterized protein n=1 Tax=Silvibacterium bohemicum TaxID=1577686 RepID=A0A841JZQ6_9BACT|nr:hypothetical protein [Silvibacterium bohemicum]MBB6145857.1 hypothetical protein [Silvibacterium bohemicum]